jgi:transcriptional regulator with XRE-family HTH domain
MLIERVLGEGPFSMHEIARETGMSYDALRSWATGRRTPRAKNIHELAAYLERHGKQLQDFADELRQQITDEGGG